jgi:hypothetical protein
MAKATAEVPEFVREAIREKAMRELASLDQRTRAFDAVTHMREVLTALVASSATATPTIVGVADGATIGRLKKLRKAIDDAKLLSDDIADALGVDERRAELDAARAEIERALASVGLSHEATAAAAE